MIDKIRKRLIQVLRPGTLVHRVAKSTHRYLWRNLPLLFNWRFIKNNIEIELTTRCNLRCLNCNRAVWQAPSDEFISVDQINKFVQESLGEHWRWQRIKLLGGEPTLHPQFHDVLSALRPYKEKHLDCEIGVGTNGYGDHVHRILSMLPEWVKVVNSGKTSNQNAFQSYYVAPIDADRLKDDNFSRGCYFIEICGLSLNRYGYYCCSPGANVDRVFGFDIGVKSLLSLTDNMLKDQLRRLCRYCGHYKYNYREEYVTREEISPSWQSAFERYRRKHPQLTLF